MHMTHMDAYTILYQAREHMTGENCIETLIRETSGEDVKTFIEDMDEKAEEIRKIALKELEQGINLIRSEFPPNVSKRMQKYYIQNKETLVETFSHKVKEVILHYHTEEM
ncbi:MAG: hypothetical protein ACRDDX_02675 [Cellulosilyticaceae bacterium]